MPFLLSIAGLSASLAGLAGLVAGLRRSDGMRRIDMFRLREIVEFAFANALIALALIPIAALTGSVDTAVRIGAGAVVVYLVAISVVLFRRLGRADITRSTWVRVAVAVDVVILVVAFVPLTTGSVASLQVVLLLLLARPMVASLFVLQSFDEDLPPRA